MERKGWINGIMTVSGILIYAFLIYANVMLGKDVSMIIWITTGLLIGVDVDVIQTFIKFKNK